MKRLFKVYRYIALLAGAFLLFSCSNTFESMLSEHDLPVVEHELPVVEPVETTAGETSSEGKARLLLSLGENSARTILPASDVQAADITRVALLAKASGASEASAVKEWNSDDTTNAISKMTFDTEILIDAGTYDFTLNLYAGETLTQVAILTNVTVQGGSNPLSFAAKYVGNGSFSLVLNGLSEQGVTAVKAGLFTVESNGETAVEGFALEDLVVSENSVTYAKTELPVGTYFVRFELYQGDVKIDTLEDIMKIASGRATSNTLTLSNINTIYSLTYNLNGGAWAEGFTPLASRNANKAVLLPAADKLTKAGYRFVGWYTDEDFSGSAVTSISAGTAENKTFYAKWAQIFNITLTASPEDGGTVTASPSQAIAGETVTLTITPAAGHGLSSLSVNDGAIAATQDASDRNKYTFTMPEGAVSVSATFVSACTLTISSVTHGSVTVSAASGIVSQTGNEYLVVPGTEVTLTFAPAKTCYKLTSFNATGATLTFGGSGNSRTFAMPESAVTISGSSELIFDGTKATGDIVVSNSSSYYYVTNSTFDKNEYTSAGYTVQGVCVNTSFMIRYDEPNMTWPNANSSYPSTSTWRLPNLTELTSIYTERNTLNTSLGNAGCTQLRTGSSQFNLYWSSEPYSTTQGNGINFADGRTYNGNEGFSSGFRVIRAYP